MSGTEEEGESHREEGDSPEMSEENMTDGLRGCAEAGPDPVLSCEERWLAEEKLAPPAPGASFLSFLLPQPVCALGTEGP